MKSRALPLLSPGLSCGSTPVGSVSGLRHGGSRMSTPCSVSGHITESSTPGSVSGNDFGNESVKFRLAIGFLLQYYSLSLVPRLSHEDEWGTHKTGKCPGCFVRRRHNWDVSSDETSQFYACPTRPQGKAWEQVYYLLCFMNYY